MGTGVPLAGPFVVLHWTRRVPTFTQGEKGEQGEVFQRSNLGFWDSTLQNSASGHWNLL